MSAAERTYAMLLRAYPAAFRVAYGREMLLVFRDQRREGARGPAFWAATLWDIVRSAPPERADALRRHWGRDIHLGGTKMKIMASLAVLIGALEIVNTLLEATARGLAGRSSIGLASIALAVVAAVLLVAAGVALLARTRGAATLARAAAFACLVVFAAIAAIRPIFSILATLVGVAFPALFLVVLYRKSGRDRPAAAR